MSLSDHHCEIIERPTSTSDRLFFKMDLPDLEEGARTYHVHLARSGSTDERELILFRDYLRVHPEEAREYAELKEKAAAEVNDDGKKYRELKEPLLKKILENVRAASQ